VRRRRRVRARFAEVLRGGIGRIVSVDGWRDAVGCGPAHDTALVDSRDRVRGCERG
jgi:hypothetical protein